MIGPVGRDLRVAAFLASRSLARGNASVTVMTVLMMAVVFISVVFLPSLINGAVATIEQQVTRTATSDLIVKPAESTTIGDAARFVDQVADVDGVAATTGTRRIGNQVAFGDQSDAWGVDAVDPGSYAEVFTTPQHLVEGEWLEPGDRHGIVLGIDIAGADRTDLRGYSASLRHVHVGDRVKVGLLGGDTATFRVRGIFHNRFVLSDQGAFVTIAAADALVDTTDPARTVEDLLEATDQLSRALTGAGAGAVRLAQGQLALAEAVDDVASATATLDDQASRLVEPAQNLAAGAARLAISASHTADSAGQLSDALSRLDRVVRRTMLPTAESAATHSADVATTAAELAATCQDAVADPARCAREAALAEDAAVAAREAAATAAQVGSISTSLSALADSAQALATATSGLAEGADALSEGADPLADGVSSTGPAAGRLASATAQVATQADRLSSSAQDFASSLGTRPGPRTEEADRDALTEAVASPVSAPGRDTVTRVFVRAAGADVAELEAGIALLRDDVEFQDAAELTAAIQDQITTFRLINDIMRVISLLVAAITVFILTYVELTNRRRQIGIERAIGIRAPAIVASYVLKSAVNALVGVAFGLMAYRVALMPFVERHPFQFPNGEVVLVADPATTRANVLMLLLVAVVAALVPTVNTIRMKILDAIWGR